RSQDVGSRVIHSVPGAHLAAVAEIEIENLRALSFIAILITAAENSAGQRALLVNAGSHQLAYLRQGKLIEFPGQTGQDGRGDAEEDIVVYVFEVPAIDLGLPGIGVGPQHMSSFCVS